MKHLTVTVRLVHHCPVPYPQMVQYYVIQLLSVLGRSRTAGYPQYPTIQ